MAGAVTAAEDLIATVADDDALRATAQRAIARCLARGRIRVAPALQPFREIGEGHFHATPEVFIQVAGSCDMQLAAGRIRSAPDDLLLIPRGVAHEEYPASGSFLNLVFSYGATSLAVHGARGAPPSGQWSRIVHRLTMASSRAPRLAGYLNDAAAHAAEGLRGDHPGVAGLIRAHVALLSDLLVADRGDQSDVDHLVLQARQQVTVHLTDPLLTVAWLAKRLRCSADYLSHRFRSVTGTALIAHVQQERCELARRLLADAALSVGEVAVACGFTDPAYFSRVFRKRVGMSPRIYRRSLG